MSSGAKSERRSKQRDPRNRDTPITPTSRFFVHSENQRRELQRLTRDRWRANNAYLVRSSLAAPFRAGLFHALADSFCRWPSAVLRSIRRPGTKTHEPFLGRPQAGLDEPPRFTFRWDVAKHWTWLQLAVTSRLACLAAEKPMTLARYCVYSIVHKDRLANAARIGTSDEFREAKPWVTALDLWQRAANDGERMVVMLGDATDCSTLLYWGVLTNVKVGASKTSYTVDRLRRLSKGHRPQELILRRTGKHIARNFIRPYAVCKTPNFVRE